MSEIFQYPSCNDGISLNVHSTHCDVLLIDAYITNVALIAVHVGPTVALAGDVITNVVVASSGVTLTFYVKKKNDTVYYTWQHSNADNDILI